MLFLLLLTAFIKLDVGQNKVVEVECTAFPKELIVPSNQIIYSFPNKSLNINPVVHRFVKIMKIPDQITPIFCVALVFSFITNLIRTNVINCNTLETTAKKCFAKAIRVYRKRLIKFIILSFKKCQKFFKQNNLIIIEQYLHSDEFYTLLIDITLISIIIYTYKFNPNYSKNRSSFCFNNTHI